MNKLKKINLMISTDPEGQGGIATVVTGYHQNTLIDDMAFISINTHSSSNKNRLSAIILFLSSLLKIIFHGRRKKLGIAHIHMSSRGSYIRKSIILRLTKFLGAKTIIHLHSGEFEMFYNKECSERKKQHIRATFNMADRIVVLSKSSLQWVNTIVKNVDKACIVYNASPEVDLPERSTKQKNILFLGRLNQNKGIEDLINSFAKIATAHPEIQLQLAGDGDITRYKTQAIKLGIASRVDFLGWISGLSKSQCLANATIYCLPSYNEAFPMGILEAMSANVAVVASTTGGIPDAITHNKEGLLIEAGNVDALAKALNILLENDDLRQEYVKAAKKKYLNNFSPDVIIPQLNNIYKELLEQK
tara:strand:+ start:1620 stop:2702 length:1083 start_codon:yes stop_codon:yes gene_type:complete